MESKEFPETDTEVVRSKCKITYSQKSEINDEIDNLKIHTDTLGGGFYFVIKTKRWAFDDIQDLINILEDFKSKMK